MIPERCGLGIGRGNRHGFLDVPDQWVYNPATCRIDAYDAVCRSPFDPSRWPETAVFHVEVMMWGVVPISKAL